MTKLVYVAGKFPYNETIDISYRKFHSDQVLWCNNDTMIWFLHLSICLFMSWSLLLFSSLLSLLVNNNNIVLRQFTFYIILSYLFLPYCLLSISISLGIILYWLLVYSHAVRALPLKAWRTLVWKSTITSVSVIKEK